ncbi:hypothetical protein ACFQ4L_07905 [Lapidilactobacillus mulanensis]|uniref:Uncharacterized protein n=1 Tax=Lapidilactobacillus mulanensis TaxID=2485999 RepID=A0ABW4DMZ3_9LACO|nr:hypothetical protein [Lapidilactobacillus mulanensis]
MSVVKVPAMKIIGQVALANTIDVNGSFYSTWQDFQDSEKAAQVDQQLLETVGETNRVGLVVYAPESYQYWTGVAVPADFEVPAKWHAFDLPAGSAFMMAATRPEFLPQLPLNFTLEKVFDQAAKEEVALPKSLGHSEQPYFLEKLTFKEIDAVEQQQYYVYISPEIEALEDDLN